ncbi:hypothetical protein Megvenef_00821 [Candidatus Megaera venefica]|uniref:Uncharacterized protein n=1 Tax=Candidatus Megaera venefica TaxID=2055910 RepID=A0ABU5NCH4_9RICK|nr:hypothetical protein [Candidatus Megaera venefica]
MIYYAVIPGSVSLECFLAEGFEGLKEDPELDPGSQVAERYLIKSV